MPMLDALGKPTPAAVELAKQRSGAAGVQAVKPPVSFALMPGAAAAAGLPGFVEPEMKNFPPEEEIPPGAQYASFLERLLDNHPDMFDKWFEHRMDLPAVDRRRPSKSVAGVQAPSQPETKSVQSEKSDKSVQIRTKSVVHEDSRVPFAVCTVCHRKRDRFGIGHVFCHACSAVDDVPLCEALLFPVLQRRRLRQEQLWLEANAENSAREGTARSDGATDAGGAPVAATAAMAPVPTETPPRGQEGARRATAPRPGSGPEPRNATGAGASPPVSFSPRPS